ncbi:hypothetical protein EU96_2054 [Prochlorococcus marinus str. MIT 9302]|uniref:Uncharacterized protein n=1 Tax=Prochlorococcus marinus str. MIT 9302 TaxID=74545 RepID=A0A0A2A331_PROMR|nr:hypothetical protein EU96_2054 [Prochlorococcus marinus str. MIT 9302]
MIKLSISFEDYFLKSLEKRKKLLFSPQQKKLLVIFSKT